MRNKAKLLAEVPLFSAFRRRELSKVASVASRITARPGDVLAKEGIRGRQFFVIADGTAEVTVDGRPVAQLGPGQFFGEMALLDRGVRTATVTARTPLSAYVIDATDFEALLDEMPFLTRQILVGVSNRLRAAEDAPSYVWNRF